MVQKRILSILAVASLLPITALASGVSFQLAKVIPLPTTDQGGDAVSYDPGNHRIYVSMGKADAGAVVINADTDQIFKVIRQGISHPDGQAFDAHYVYWTSNPKVNGKSVGRIVVIAKQGWQVRHQFSTVVTSPDGIWTDPARHRLYIAMDDNNRVDKYTLSAQPKFLGTIPLFPKVGDGPDLGVLVPSQQVLYMPDDSWEEKINLRNDHIEAITNIARYFSTSPNGHHVNTKGQIFDPQTNTLWVGTDRGQLFVFNAKSLKVLAHLPARAGIDQVAYDPTYHLVYAFESDAKGFNVYNAQTLKPVTFVSTGYGKTHTGAVDPLNHRIFVYAGEAHGVYVYQPVLGGTAKTSQ